MRRKLPLLFGAVFLAFAAGACEGPQGPEGPAGPEGPEGPRGPAGQDGQDGTNALNTCSDCHTSDATLVAIEQQFSLSPHGFGNFEVRGPSYAGGSCAACHTSQGFVANATGGTADYTGGAASMNCRTCHQIHQTFIGPDDFTLTTTDPVTLIVTGNTYDASATDVPGSNMCASCHQARSESSYPAFDAPVTQDFEIPSSHYDFHHGPQTNVFTANFPASVMYGVSGNSTYGPHESPACLGCHMGFGSDVGDVGTSGLVPGGTLGHNFAPAGSICSDCHSDTEGLDHNGVRTAVNSTIVSLAACLEAEGVVTVDPGDGHAFHAVVDDPNTPTVNEGLHPEPFVAAYMMVAAIEEDGSWGAHNPNFVTSLLDAIGANLDTNSTLTECDYTSAF